MQFYQRMRSWSMPSRRLTLLALFIALAVVARGDSPTEADNPDDDTDMATSFGEPAEAADAPRTIRFGDEAAPAHEMSQPFS